MVNGNEINVNSLVFEQIGAMQKYLLDTKVKSFKIIFADGVEKEVKRKYLILSLYFWKYVIKRKVPLTSEFLLPETRMDAEYISRIGTLFINKVREMHPENPKYFLRLNYDLWLLINELMNFSIKECQEYQSGIDMLDLIKIKNSSEVQEIIRKSRLKMDGADIAGIEDDLKTSANDLYELLNKKYLNGVGYNPLYPFTQLKGLSATQMNHIFNCIGFRTDLDDSLISYPITSGYLDGLKNNFQYIVESLSAKKSKFYIKRAIATSQYFLRKQHILVSAIAKIYSGDCGSRIPVPFMITEVNAKNVIGKNIILDNGDLMLLTRYNVASFLNKIVNFKSICHHTDGICEACGGEKFKNIPRNINIGVFASILVADPVVQKILSDKHFQMTYSIEYNVPSILGGILVKKQQDIFFRNAIKEKLANSEIGFAASKCKPLLNIENINVSSFSSINETAFGNVSSLFLKYKDKYLFDREILLSNDDNHYPLFSKEFLIYVRKNIDNKRIENNIIWISLKDFDPNQPIFKTTIMNDSMTYFVSSVQKFIESKITKYTSFSEALTDFSNLIYHKVNMDISFIEIMLRAYSIKNNLDVRIAKDIDPQNMKFGSNLNINIFRSLGGLLAFERINSALSSPALFLVPKKSYMFDRFLNLKRRREL